MKTEESFFTRVYTVVRSIPYGRVTSYGAIAAYIGSPGAARMVGWAMNASHTAVPPVPAHRVLNRTGTLTGKHHFGSPNRMEEMLNSEGIETEANQVIRFNELFWDPARELL